MHNDYCSMGFGVQGYTHIRYIIPRAVLKFYFQILVVYRVNGVISFIGL